MRLSFFQVAASCYRDMLVMVEQEKNLRRDLLEGGVTGKLTLNRR